MRFFQFLAHAVQLHHAPLQPVEEEIDHRRSEEREHLRDDKAADDGDAFRVGQHAGDFPGALAVRLILELAQGTIPHHDGSLSDRLGVLCDRLGTYVYADGAGEQFESAQKYVSERVQERPLTATMTALGVGVFIGLLLGGSRR